MWAALLLILGICFIIWSSFLSFIAFLCLLNMTKVSSNSCPVVVHGALSATLLYTQHTHTHTRCEVYYRRVVEQNLPGLFKRLVQGPVQEVTDKITCGGESPWVPYTSTHTDINLTEQTSALFCVSPPCVNAVQPLLCVWPSRSLWRSDSSGSTDLATPKLLSVLLDPHEGWAMCI